MTDLYPSRIAAGGNGGLVVQADANRFLILDRGFATLGNVSPLQLQAQDGSGATIERVLDWTLAGDDIVGFAEVKLTEAQWTSGPVRFSTKKQEGFRLLHDLGTGDASRKYHRLGYGYTTSLGATSYYLLMGNGIHLWKQEGGRKPQDLGDLESSFPLWKSSPQLQSFVNPKDYEEVMETVERSSMPTGLYGWTDPAGQQALYLVSRQWQSGETQWLLSKIKPENGRVQGTSRIVSNANHLFLVPGPSQWAVVEKGKAGGLREQEVKGVYSIPAEKIRKAFQPGRTQVLDICQ